jgi:hypothetical protein
MARIVFGMPEEEYHAFPALSASGIKWLAISPMDFWARSWMNPNREPDEEKDHLELGKAYHKRILEGRAAFDAVYAPELDTGSDENAGALRTVAEMKDALKERGHPVSGNRDELMLRLRTVAPDVKILDRLESAHQLKHEGKTLLPFAQIARIETAAAMIEKHPELRKVFTGGQPEVSIFWDEEGVPMKARLDYLKPHVIPDLKSFSNPLKKSLLSAIAGTMAQRKYYVQAAVYMRAAESIYGALDAGNVEGEHDPHWLRRVAEVRNDEREFLFVFQQTGPAPLAVGKVLPRRCAAFGIGEDVMYQAIAKFRALSAAFDPGEPWVDTTPISAFDTGDFPPWVFKE